MTRSDGDAQPARRGYRLVALLIAVGVVALLVGAYTLDRRYRPAVGIAPLPPDAAGNTQSAPQSSAPSTGTSATTLPWPRIGRTNLEREIEDAYARYWEIRQHAYLNLDTSRLPEVLAGDGLRAEQDLIRDLERQGRAAKLVYQHLVRFDHVSDDRAIVRDDHMNYSVFVDWATRRELPTSSAPQLEQVSYELRKLEGKWKVVAGVLHN